MRKSPKIYLDYAATTPVDPVVLRAMKPYFSEKFGNAGSLHSFGQEAIGALDMARETIAAAVGADFQEIIFTGSATEANNLVLRGILKNTEIKKEKPRIIISSIEHESVLETARDIEREGNAEIVYLPVDRAGIIDLKKLGSEMDKNTILISIMYANNEIGSIQPIRQIIELINNFKKNNPTAPGHSPVLFHTDAAQAFQFLDCDTAALGVDLMTLSSQKIYGPKGAGALYIKKQKALKPIITGGGQEFGIRAGTENIPAITGFSKAAEQLADLRAPISKKITEMRDELWYGVKKIFPKAEANGTLSQKKQRKGQPLYLPNVLNIYFPGRSAEDLLTKFDLAGLAASSGSACRARASSSSYVIEALGYSKERGRSSIRFSLGRPTTKKEIARALGIIKKTVGGTP
jgi:cysteine desulfurase